MFVLYIMMNVERQKFISLLDRMRELLEEVEPHEFFEKGASENPRIRELTEFVDALYSNEDFRESLLAGNFDGLIDRKDPEFFDFKDSLDHMKNMIGNMKKWHASEAEAVETGVAPPQIQLPDSGPSPDKAR